MLSIGQLQVTWFCTCRTGASGMYVWGTLPFPAGSAVEEDFGFGPDVLQAVVEAHGFEFVHPHAVIVWPVSQWIRIHHTDSEACNIVVSKH